LLVKMYFLPKNANFVKCCHYFVTLTSSCMWILSCILMHRLPPTGLHCECHINCIVPLQHLYEYMMDGLCVRLLLHDTGAVTMSPSVSHSVTLIHLSVADLHTHIKVCFILSFTDIVFNCPLISHATSVLLMIHKPT